MVLSLSTPHRARASTLAVVYRCHDDALLVCRVRVRFIGVEACEVGRHSAYQVALGAEPLFFWEPSLCPSRSRLWCYMLLNGAGLLMGLASPGFVGSFPGSRCSPVK